MECLIEANKHMQVGIFTASNQTYADAILDYLDPHNKLFSFRLYRQHCVQTPEGYYVKDLRIISNIGMHNMVLVDNSVYSFAYQLDNGIPIIPFYDDPKDEELCHLIFYIENLTEVEDMRVANQRAFELKSLGLKEDDIEESKIPQDNELGVVDLMAGNQEDEDLLSSSALDKLLD